MPVKKADIHIAGGDAACYDFLKRKREVLSTGTIISANEKYVKIVLKRLGLDHANAAPTPSTESLAPRPDDADEPLDAAKGSEFRSLACILLYVCHDLAEAQHACRNLTCDLVAPNVKRGDR